MNIKPNQDELFEVLIRLTTIADNCIPSDDCSNSQLAVAEEVIAESWALIDRMSRANVAAAVDASMAHMGAHPNTDECTAACNNTVPDDDDILAYLKMPLQVRTIDGVDVQYHPSQPIDYLLEEAAKEIERCRGLRQAGGLS